MMSTSKAVPSLQDSVRLFAIFLFFFCYQKGHVTSDMVEEVGGEVPLAMEGGITKRGI